MSKAGSGAPESGREDDDGKKKEDACHFEPEDSADAAKGTEEAADALREAAARSVDFGG